MPKSKISTPSKLVSVRVLRAVDDGTNVYAAGDEAEMSEQSVNELLALDPPAVQLVQEPTPASA